MDSLDLRSLPSPEQLAQTAAADCLQQICQDSAAGRIFSLALSGGRIAKTFCCALADQVQARHLSLSTVHFFWSDERCVPPDDSESNFRLANESLLIPLNIPRGQIHRIEGEKPPPEAAAAARADLQSLVSFTPSGQPVIDLVLLGMGEDGHVASLFPGEPQQAMADPSVFRCVTAVKPPPLRITMGYPAIAAARQVWVLVSGAGKAGALRESLAPNGRTPLARVLQLRSSARIYSDISPDSLGIGN